MAAPDLLTVEVAGKILPCYQEGEETFILYSNLIKEFKLSENTSLSTQQRRKNKVSGTNQHCPSMHLQKLKDAGMASKAAKNVAVLTVEQAHQLLQLYNIPDDAHTGEEADLEELQRDTPSVGQEASASGGNPALGESSTKSVAIEDPDDEPLTPPSCKAARLAKVKKVDLKVHQDIDQKMKEVVSFWTKELNHKRGTPPLSRATMDKTQERLLGELAVGQVDVYCIVVLANKLLGLKLSLLHTVFLGFLERQSQQTPQLDCLIDLQTVDMFLKFLKVPKHTVVIVLPCILIISFIAGV